MQCGILCVSDEAGVTFSFKDLFDKLDDRLRDGFKDLGVRMDRFELKLDQKADNTRVAQLEKRMAEHELRVDERLKPIELASAGVSAVTNFQRWVIGTVGVGVLGSIATLVWLASGGH
jgi:hypothetical protein